jgi:hypothetical protein
MAPVGLKRSFGSCRLSEDGPAHAALRTFGSKWPGRARRRLVDDLRTARVSGPAGPNAQPVGAIQGPYCSHLGKTRHPPARFWTTAVGESNNDLTYIIPSESLAEREAKCTAFVNDPAWHKARDESERDGPIVATIRNEMLTPTAFSALK